MKWEYQTVRVDTQGNYIADTYLDDDDDWQTFWAHIDELGKKGWELVAISHSEDSEATAWFKRPVEEANKNG